MHLTRARPASSPVWRNTCPVLKCPFMWALWLPNFTLSMQSREHTSHCAEKWRGVARGMAEEAPGDESSALDVTSYEPLMTRSLFLNLCGL